MPALLHIGIATTSGVLRVECLQPSMAIQVGYMFPPPALVPLVLSMFLAEHVKGQLRQMILVVPHVGRCSIMVPHHKRSCHGCLSRPHAQGSAISAFNPLAAQQCVLWRQGFSSLVCQAVTGAIQASTSKVYQQYWKEWVGWCAQQGVPNNAISAPKLSNFFVHVFQVCLAWHTIGVYHMGISAVLEPHHLHKSSNHPVISKLMHHFYLQHPPSCKHFDPWDIEHLVSFLESWALVSSLTTFKLAWKTATLLTLVTAKHSDLTLLCIDNQHLFLQHHAAIFIPLSGGKTDHLGHPPPQIHIVSHSSVNLCPVFLFEGLFEMY